MQFLDVKDNAICDFCKTTKANLKEHTDLNLVFCDNCHGAYQVGFNDGSNSEDRDVWQCVDPRNVIYKRAYIAILHPDGRIGTAYVDTKDGWHCHTSFEEHKSIDKWDTKWLWVRLPNKT